MIKVKKSNIDEFKFYYGVDSLSSYLGQALKNKTAKFYTVLEDNLYIMDFWIYILNDNDIELSFNYNNKIKNTILKEDILNKVIKYLSRNKYNNIYITLVEHIKGIETPDFALKKESILTNGFVIISELDNNDAHAIKFQYKNSQD